MNEWILLRGLTRESRHWGDFPQRLAAALGGAPVRCLDLPGNGRLNRLRSPWRVEAMADYCHAEIVKTGGGRPCNVVAMSLGAMVTVAWAQRHVGDLASAVLINTSLQPFSPFFERLRPRSYRRLAGLLNPARSAADVEATILRLTSCGVQDAALVELWQQWRCENPVSPRNALRQLVAAARYRAPPQAPRVPLLLLAGAGDALVNPNCSQRLATCWQVPLLVHPWGGHDLPLDDGEWVRRQIVDWHDRMQAGDHPAVA